MNNAKGWLTVAALAGGATSVMTLFGMPSCASLYTEAKAVALEQRLVADDAALDRKVEANHAAATNAVQAVRVEMGEAVKTMTTELREQRGLLVDILREQRREKRKVE